MRTRSRWIPPSYLSILYPTSIWLAKSWPWQLKTSELQMILESLMPQILKMNGTSPTPWEYRCYLTAISALPWPTKSCSLAKQWEFCSQRRQSKKIESHLMSCKHFQKRSWKCPKFLNSTPFYFQKSLKKSESVLLADFGISWWSKLIFKCISSRSKISSSCPEVSSSRPSCRTPGTSWVYHQERAPKTTWIWALLSAPSASWDLRMTLWPISSNWNFVHSPFNSKTSPL